MGIFIIRPDAKPFLKWFNKPENRGHFVYDGSGVILILRDLLTYHYEVAYDIQLHKSEYSAEDFNRQSSKVLALSTSYSQVPLISILAQYQISIRSGILSACSVLAQF